MNSNTRMMTEFLRLLNGEVLVKRTLADQYAVAVETIQRDIATIKNALEESDLRNGLTLVNPQKGQYQLKQEQTSRYSLVQKLMLIEILLASRATTKTEMTALIQPLLAGETRQLTQLTKSDTLNYVGMPRLALAPKIAMVIQAIQENRQLRFEYARNNQHEILTRQPSGIYFADLYFYMMTDNHRGYDDKDIKKAVKFRINKMTNLTLLGRSPSSSRTHHFEGGKLRNQTPLPFLGNPITLEIEFYADASYVLDRFPHAIAGPLLPGGGQRFSIPANDGFGVKMWLLQQGQLVKILSPKSVRDYVIQEMRQTLNLYH